MTFLLNTLRVASDLSIVCVRVGCFGKEMGTTTPGLCDGAEVGSAAGWEGGHRSGKQEAPDLQQSPGMPSGKEVF